MTATASIAAKPSPRRTESPAGRRSLHELVESSGLRSLVVGVSKDPNPKLTVLLVSPRDGRPALAVKAPMTDLAAEAVEAERRLLIDLHALRPGPVLETIPAVVDVTEFEGRPAVVMTAVAGVPMTTSYLGWRHTAGRERVAADFAAAQTWLAELQAGTAGQAAPIDMDGGVVSRLEGRFDRDELPGADLSRLAGIHARLARHTVPRTAVHGDFWFGNLLLAEGRVSGVVDWEAGSTRGEPVRDLVRFALMYALYLDWRTRPGRRVAGHPGLRAVRWGTGIQYALGGAGWFCDIFRRFLADGLSRLGASPASWRDAALAGIAEVAALTDDDAFARRHIELFRRIAGSESPRKAGP